MPNTPLVISTAHKKAVLKVRVARTFLSRALGLSFRKKFPGEGLLFVFSHPVRPPFWMWGMKLDIDIIWICKRTVIGFAENLSAPKNYLSLIFPFFLKWHYPPQPVDAVLEVPAGFVKKHGLNLESIIDIPHALREI